MVDVLGERATLERVLRRRSLARFGDGELKLVHGEDSLTERWTPRVADELRDILKSDACLVGLPHTRGLRPEYWQAFLATHSTHIPQLVAGTSRDRVYGSSFVTRGDESAVVHDPGYRRAMSFLWRHRDVVLVTGGGSLTREHLRTAKSIRIVPIPSRDAAQVVDDIQVPDGDIILLCAGACGTILANRLADKGKWAVDLGYIGKILEFYRLHRLRRQGVPRDRGRQALHRREADPRL